MDLNGNELYIFHSIIEATAAVGLHSRSGIDSVCHGTRKTAGGYKWKFLDSPRFENKNFTCNLLYFLL